MSNLVYNEQKTNELIEQLKAKGHITSVSDLSAMIRQSGVILSETIGRKRSYVEVPTELYGVSLAKKEEGTQKFFKSHVKKGKISYIPDDYEKKLVNVEGRARIARRRACIGFNQKFMPMEDYDKFADKFNVWKQEYFEIRDNIVRDWDKLIADFKENLIKSAKDLNAIDLEILIDTIMGKIPTKTEYADSFVMELYAEAFPVADNLAMFTPKAQEAMRKTADENAIKAMYQFISENLDKLFVQASKLIISIKDGRGNGNSIKQMSTLAKQVRKNNVLDNDVVTALAEDADKIGRMNDKDEILDASEALYLKAFAYAKELKLEDSLSWIESPYTEHEAGKLLQTSNIKVSSSVLNAAPVAQTVPASTNVSNGNVQNQTSPTNTAAPAVMVPPTLIPEEAPEVIEPPKEAVNAIYANLSLSINQAFAQASSLIQFVIDETAIDASKLEEMNDIAVHLRQNNVLADDKMVKIADLAEALAIIPANDSDSVAEKAEELIGFIYHYAKELGIEGELLLTSTPFTKDELDELANFLY